jgi:hypothetical protein
MNVDKPAIPRMRPFRVAVMPYFDVPNGEEPELDFGYTEEQMAHSIRIIATVSYLSLSIIPHENNLVSRTVRRMMRDYSKRES